MNVFLVLPLKFVQEEMTAENLSVDHGDFGGL